MSCHVLSRKWFGRVVPFDLSAIYFKSRGVTQTWWNVIPKKKQTSLPTCYPHSIEKWYVFKTNRSSIWLEIFWVLWLQKNNEKSNQKPPGHTRGTRCRISCWVSPVPARCPASLWTANASVEAAVFWAVVELEKMMESHMEICGNLWKTCYEHLWTHFGGVFLRNLWNQVNEMDDFRTYFKCVWLPDGSWRQRKRWTKQRSKDCHPLVPIRSRHRYSESCSRWDLEETGRTGHRELQGEASGAFKRTMDWNSS